MQGFFLTFEKDFFYFRDRGVGAINYNKNNNLLSA